jgi:hypothetical protein
VSTVVGCYNLKDKEWFTKQDPYVVIEYSGQKFRTRTDTGWMLLTLLLLILNPSVMTCFYSGWERQSFSEEHEGYFLKDFSGSCVSRLGSI